MGTPERSKNNRIATSSRRFEDSPTFDFLINLSPIKPIKPMPFTQTFNQLTLASLESVFTSPHVASLNECQVLRRPQLSYPLRPEFSTNNNVDDDTKPDGDHKENLDPTPPENHEVSNVLYLQKRSDIIAELMSSPTSSSNWDDLISKPSNSSVEPATSFYNSIEHIMQNRQPCGGMFSGNSSAQPEEECKMMKIDETLGTNGESSIQNPCDNVDYQQISGLHSGVGRRRLVFNNSTSGSCMQENDSSSIFPRISLHLNALVPIPEDYDIVDNHSLVYRTSLIKEGPFTSFHRPPTSSNQEMSGSILTKFSSKRKRDNVENAVARVEDSCLESGYIENEEINPCSPKRKRSEQVGKGDSSCKRCTCKKSKCLKLYCECFAAGVYCMGPCACINCFNKPVHRDIVHATRKQIKAGNPFAFSPKVISEIEDDLRTTPASARHKKGCNCKKSGCLKKYCECYQSGVGCSITCRCEGCKNTLDTKDGSGVVSMDHELEEGETNASKRVELNRSFQITTIPDNLQQTVEYAPASGFPARLAVGKSSFLSPPPKFSHFLESVEEEKIPEFLLEGPSNGGTKLVLSPNGKRVSPPKRLLE